MQRGINMSPKSKFRGLSTLAAALTAIFLLFFNVGGTKDKIWHLIKPDLISQNAQLKNENERLIGKINALKNHNKSLKTILDAYEHNFIALKDAAGKCDPIPPVLPIDLPVELMQERLEIRQIYRQMLAEKRRWDQYQQQKYKSILESTLEPAAVEVQGLNLENEENMDYFHELESALNLHKRLIRDVRVFHDEIKFQKKQLHARQPYELYDLKFKLAPFTRESALVDALQQAMSALSAGIYEQEAVAVLDRIGDEFTKPIQQLYEQQWDNNAPSTNKKYNYNFYTLFGKKLMDYCDRLAGQSAVSLGPSAFGELDFFRRELSESLYDLYRAGQNEAIDPGYLDLNELEQILNAGD
jgi:3-dehydroquinate dehydratase